MESQALTTDPPKYLTEREVEAWRYGTRRNIARIAPTTAAQLFELFLNGKTCEEIRKANPQWQLAQIVLARVEGKWDDLRAEYQASLLAGVRERYQQAQLETIVLVSDMLSASKKVIGQRLDRFMVTGDEKELDGLNLTNIKAVKDLLEMLLKATGQDNKTTSKMEVTHKVEQAPTPAIATRLTPDQADAVLKFIESKEEEK